MITLQSYAAQQSGADDYLSRISTDKLLVGLKRGRDQLALIDAIEQIDHQEMDADIGHPGRHPSKDYERYIAADAEFRRRQLHSAINDTEAELRRRGVKS